jgi:uncharacterized protein with von Willebrand factor type A (vWA) domain
MSFCQKKASKDQQLLKEMTSSLDDPNLMQLIKNLAMGNEHKEPDKTQTAPQKLEEVAPPLFPEETPSRGEMEFVSDMQPSSDLEAGQPENEPSINEETLHQLQEKGMIQINPDGEIRVTFRGSRALARLALREILLELARRQQHFNPERIGYGASRQPWTRRYKLGDSYENVDVEKTLVNSLCRKTDNACITLDMEDFEIREAVDEDRLMVGLLIDESRSMHKGNKMRAAIETAMALSELIIQRPQHELKVYTFSDSVKEIPFWEIINQIMDAGATDQRSALEAFRKAAHGFEGRKEIYLITDSEPNSEKGRYIRFQWARLGVLEEVCRLRKENITLNIIMLDDRPPLMRLAQELAKRNLGRVFFTTPNQLGQVVIEDYLQRQDHPLWKKRTFVPLSPSLEEETPIGYPYVDTSKVTFWDW